MITAAFIDLSYALLTWFLSLFPAGTGFPSAAHDAAKALGGYFGVLDPLVPISTLVSCVSLIVSVEVGLFGFRTLKWIISHIPAIGGRG